MLKLALASITCCMFICLGLVAQTPVRFEHFSRRDGLPSETVTKIYQDHQGVLWIGTIAGLSRYDGYTFRTYKSNPKHLPHSLSHNWVTAMVEDRQNQLWIATGGGGINLFDRGTGTFTAYPLDTTNVNDRNACSAMISTRDGMLWVAALSGLYRLDPQTRQLTHYKHDPARAGHRKYAAVISLCEGNAGELWVGTQQGLYRFDRRTETFTGYSYDPDLIRNGGENIIIWIHQTRRGELLVCTHDGFLLFDPASGQFTPQPYATGYMGSNRSVYRIHEDADGTLWIGSAAGLSRLHPGSGCLTTYAHAYDDPASLSSNEVYSLLRDRSGILWVGTQKGLNKVDPFSSRFPAYPLPPLPQAFSADNHISALHEDRRGILWICIQNQVLLYDRKTHRYAPFRVPRSAYAGDLAIYDVLERPAGIIWLSTNKGLVRHDYRDGTFNHYIPEPGSLRHSRNEMRKLFAGEGSSLWVEGGHELGQFNPHDGSFRFYPLKNPVAAVTSSRSGAVWVGTIGGGLVKIEPASGKWSRYFAGLSPGGKLNLPDIRSIHEDARGDLWLGTNGGGLNRFNPVNGERTIFSEDNGLPGNAITDALVDRQGNLWLNTDRGLCRFNLDSHACRNYDTRDGLVAEEASSMSLNGQGEIRLGGSRSFNIFHPDSIEHNDFRPPLIISGLRVADQPVAYHPGEPLRIPYAANVISFEFAALSFSNPARNQYAYQLDGFREGWVQAGTRRFTTYTNLNPGTYTFRVKGANNDGVWNNRAAEVSFVVLPPWWRTWWAYSLYAACGLAALLIGRWEIVRRERLKASLRVQEVETRKLRELDTLKSRFFANISHEFRTPLTLILGTAEVLLQENKKAAERKELYGMLRRNAGRLLQLINQLLDLSRLEAGKLQLDDQPGDLTHFLHTVAYSFTSLAEKHGIRYTVHLPNQGCRVRYDADKLEKVFANLLSNAFKFTPAGGTVTLSARVEELPSQPACRLTLTVADTGIGIPSDQLPRIFDRFYQADSSVTRGYEGSGVGLTLARELTELHGGTLDVQSTLGEYTVFTVTLTLPLARAEGQPVEYAAPLVSLPVAENPPGEAVSEAAETIPAAAPQLPYAEAYQNKVLVVEDNCDLRQYIRRVLPKEYVVLEAENGVAGWELALEALPDLVISDVMMPEVDGFTLCRRIKAHAVTAHIPVILLTARAETDDKIRGLLKGADDYMTKPFHAQELSVRVSTLIRERAQLRQLFGGPLLQVPKNPVSSPDEVFLKRVRDAVERNLPDADFDVEALGKEVALSRTQLYRKLFALTNQSPSDFIRTTRLRRAAVLLEQKAGNVAEVAYMVGFKEASHFSRLYSKEYGHPPSEYAQKRQN